MTAGSPRGNVCTTSTQYGKAGKVRRTHDASPTRLPRQLAAPPGLMRCDLPCRPYHEGVTNDLEMLEREKKEGSLKVKDLQDQGLCRRTCI